ncbi:hypothetical protein TSUD_53580 [Trifolium subterraneum]|uniref:Uncharacterized protein n=1 Tax=Trifolium subterraneum TaxID=3900 RepID=A0A2Z6ML14_TRISU|nr:hypothetical protein TSUD_53580 [Trifolium subterraneum]
MLSTNFTPPHHQLGRLFITVTSNAPARYMAVGDAAVRFAVVDDMTARIAVVDIEGIIITKFVVTDLS